jgi:membrane protein
MNGIVFIILGLAVLISVEKISQWSFRHILIYSILCGAALFLSAHFVAQWPLIWLDVSSPVDRRISEILRLLTWIDGFMMLSYCWYGHKSGVGRNLLSFYPGVACFISFYFMLSSSFLIFNGVNFALCGAVCGIAVAAMLVLLAFVFKRFLTSFVRLEILFSTLIVDLVLVSFV